MYVLHISIETILVSGMNPMFMKVLREAQGCYIIILVYAFIFPISNDVQTCGYDDTINGAHLQAVHLTSSIRTKIIIIIFLPLLLYYNMGMSFHYQNTLSHPRLGNCDELCLWLLQIRTCLSSQT